MAGTPIPTLVAGTVFTAAEFNTLPALNEQVGLLGVQGAAVGSPPAVGSPEFSFQAGYFNQVSTGLGVVTITFPAAYANGIIGVWVQATNSDGVGSFLLNGAPTTTGFTAYALSSSAFAVVANVNVVGMWLALGF